MEPANERPQLTALLPVELAEVSALKFDPNNARKHGEKNILAIKESLSRFGQRRAIVVFGDVVIAGNGTLEAARQLGWKEVSITRVPEDWSEEEARAYALADNRTAELAEWDSKMLADTLADLDSSGWKIQELGFEPIEQPEATDWENALAATANEKKPIQQITFTLHDDQAEIVRNALEAAKDLGDFGDTGNPNDNGNALARVAELFLGGLV